MKTFLMILVLTLICGAAAAADSKNLPPLRVSDNHRFLATADGRPFFWLADTAWQLIHDLDEADMRRYFADRSKKGFTVIQTVALVELRADKPNAFGHFPIEPKRPDRPIVAEGPDNDYWDDVERVVQRAADYGLYVGLLPTWGKYVTSDWQNGLVDGFFNVANAESYGRFLGERLKHCPNVVWIIGGDKAAPTDAARAIWRSLARGIALGVAGTEDYSKVLMTYHTSGPGSTAWFWNDEPWLDFHALQSGHGRWAMNWMLVEHAYTMKPVRPVIDLETSYPEFRHGRPPTTATDDDARRAAYWAVFAGAAGHTYGHHSIWQMHSPKYPGVAHPQRYWYEALDAPSAAQMGYLRRLIESRPFLTQRPDLSLLAFEQTRPWEMCLALRGDGFALIYTPTGRTLDIALGKTSGAAITASWYNPRTGETTAIGRFDNRGRRAFDPPGDEAAGNDWVLVLENSEKAAAVPNKTASALAERDAHSPPAVAQSPIPYFEGLRVEAIGKTFLPDPARTVLYQSKADSGGNTSVRNTDRANLEWKAQGYYQRNRDLGQVFTAPRGFRLESIVLRTGPADGAVLDGAPGAKVFLQFFEVSGEPRIHDNGTPPGTAATHGFSKNHRCDDYLAGVEYKPLYVVAGGVFPALPPTRDSKGQPVENQNGRLTYLRWQLPDAARLECKAGKRYAFMAGFEHAGQERGFTLANCNAASVNAPPSLTDAHNPYLGGWAIRREGDGTLPPTIIAGEAPPADAVLRARMLGEALFPDAPDRFELPPTTNGFPDVDTYRDLEFYLEAESGG